MYLSLTDQSKNPLNLCYFLYYTAVELLHWIVSYHLWKYRDVDVSV